MSYTSLSVQIKNYLHQNLPNKLISEAGEEFSLLCPFHPNTDTPSFFLNKQTGLYFCHNPSCGAKGTWIDFVKKISGEEIDFAIVELPLNLDENEQPIFDFLDAMDRITIDYKKDISKLQYLIDRGFEPMVLEHFEVGYSEKQNRIVIPLRAEDFRVVGFIGRALTEDQKPKYLYSKKLPKHEVLFNLQNCKNYSTAIITEGSLDAMKVHQSGFPNVVSMLGANVTDAQMDLLNAYFDGIIIFADQDEAGQTLKNAVINKCPQKDISIVVHYPGDKKDAGEMDESEIRIALRDKMNILDYLFEYGK